MTCIIVTIEPETQHRPLRVRAHTRGCTVTLEYDWNRTPRANAHTAATAHRDRFLKGKAIGLCKEDSRNKYRFPILG